MHLLRLASLSEPRDLIDARLHAPLQAPLNGYVRRPGEEGLACRCLLLRSHGLSQDRFKPPAKPLAARRDASLATIRREIGGMRTRMRTRWLACAWLTLWLWQLRLVL